MKSWQCYALNQHQQCMYTVEDGSSCHCTCHVTVTSERGMVFVLTDVKNPEGPKQPAISHMAQTTDMITIDYDIIRNPDMYTTEDLQYWATALEKPATFTLAAKTLYQTLNNIIFQRENEEEEFPDEGI